MMPTFNELLGTEATWTQATDGISIFPSLIGQGTQQEHDYLYWEFHEEGGRQCLRQGPWVLLRQKISTSPTIELYNVEEDLNESIELSAKYPEKLQELLTLMEGARTQSSLFNFGK
jgi:arylsulfatase A-like enzyme